ncbi:unnamed protein product [Protopolystoma xenopodis]|uniref:Uncharacterized protein n=1 Tax=Protopolystoma xenopodis TaxID=117903 RepID=A0A3S5ABS4_9PLAT|nr:unnamed protein product [Protopolystoma xenopodis]
MESKNQTTRAASVRDLIERQHCSSTMPMLGQPSQSLLGMDHFSPEDECTGGPPVNDTAAITSTIETGSFGPQQELKAPEWSSAGARDGDLPRSRPDSRLGVSLYGTTGLDTLISDPAINADPGSPQVHLLSTSRSIGCLADLRKPRALVSPPLSWFDQSWQLRLGGEFGVSPAAWFPSQVSHGMAGGSVSGGGRHLRSIKQQRLMKPLR